MKKIVMLVETGTQLPKNFLMAIGHEGYSVHIVSTIEEVQADIDTKQYGVIIVDAENYEARDQLSEDRPEIFGLAYDIFDQVSADNPDFLDAIKEELKRAFEEFAG